MYMYKQTGNQSLLVHFRVVVLCCIKQSDNPSPCLVPNHLENRAFYMPYTASSYMQLHVVTCTLSFKTRPCIATHQCIVHRGKVLMKDSQIFRFAGGAQLYGFLIGLDGLVVFLLLVEVVSAQLDGSGLLQSRLCAWLCRHPSL